MNALPAAISLGSSMLLLFYEGASHLTLRIVFTVIIVVDPIPCPLRE